MLEGVEIYRFLLFGEPLLLLNAIGGENFEKMQLDRPLQLGAEEYFK